ncbi:aggrecan core protein-like [Antedon mediterranea]|uniref:aggrecan core protein-like n=1 Tax=Antedon mediterranea TaxID=105859 RepID=UPI003AF97705
MNTNVQDKASTADFQQDLSYEYIEKVLDDSLNHHDVFSILTISTYEVASSTCTNNLGSLASYEQLYNAYQPRMDNCFEGWLISGEIAFIEISGDKCTLNSPDQRSNVFPDKTYESGYYCYRGYNQLLGLFDYIPKTQRIIRLTGLNSDKLNGSEAEARCSDGGTGGRLATPFEVFNASYSLGVDLCTDGWFLRGLAGNPCSGNTPSTFWLYPTGNFIWLQDPSTEWFAMCYIPLPNHSITYQDPFPSHRVMYVRGIERYQLTYQDAKDRCSGYTDGALATSEQVEASQLAGYDCCNYGWVDQGTRVMYPVTHYIAHECDINNARSAGANSKYDGFCYIAAPTRK